MIRSGVRPRQRLLASEVVQTSAMDCGVASLKCLLEGFGIHASYGRLREACQTDVDGTSIDTIEDVAVQLGLEAEQIMIPLDHVLLCEAAALPALVVVRLPNAVTHFVVAWRKHGPFVQVMDPGTGRRWPTCRQFLDEVYVHAAPVSAHAWREWAGSDVFLDALRRRLADDSLAGARSERLIEDGLSDAGWRSLAALDAAARMVGSIVRSGGLPRRSDEAVRLLERLVVRVCEDTSVAREAIPDHYWSARPDPRAATGEDRLLLRGAVLVTVRGVQRTPTIALTQPSPVVGEGAGGKGPEIGPAPLSPELVAALKEPPARPGRKLLTLLRADGLLAPSALVGALMLAAAGVLLEALLFRGVLDLGYNLTLAGQRVTALAALIVFLLAMLLVELPIVSTTLRLGRRLEARLRVAFLEKIPRLGDRYFHSRPTSDMAERCHSIHQIRALPAYGAGLLRSFFELLLTTAGIAWIDPPSAPLASVAATLSLGLPLAVQPVLAERDLRVRTHSGALSRFYLDALLGLVAVRTHGAERSLRREHESLLVEWARAALGRQRIAVAVEGLQFFTGFGLAAWLLLDRLARGGEPGAVLLLAYWALFLPMLGQEVALVAWQYPSHRSLALRLMEPLGAPEETEGSHPHPLTPTLSPSPVPPWGGGEGDASLPRGGEEGDASLSRRGGEGNAHGVKIALERVSVRIAGHIVLHDIDLTVTPRSHVAIVGPSGAGKSTLVGLLLGWYRPAAGTMLVDDSPLVGARLDALRRETAWVDPAVQLWNRSLVDNLRYGAGEASSLAIGEVIEAADLRDVLERLPDGLQTRLGEGGGLVSGGEGQRVRLGRGLLRPNARLVILDEPFRGLERERRRALLGRARALWRNATLLCITHDVIETQSFDRVVVLDEGRIVEDGDPRVLGARHDSRYRAMLDADLAIRSSLWSDRAWRGIRLERGRLVAEPLERST